MGRPDPGTCAQARSASVTQPTNSVSPAAGPQTSAARATAREGHAKSKTSGSRKSGPLSTGPARQKSTTPT